MSDTTTSRNNNRAKLFKRLNTGTDRRARKHQQFETRLIEEAQRLVPSHCIKCGATTLVMDPTMCGSTHADGEPLVYWRCAGCRALFSRLTPPMGTAIERTG